MPMDFALVPDFVVNLKITHFPTSHLCPGIRADALFFPHKPLEVPRSSVVSWGRLGLELGSPPQLSSKIFWRDGLYFFRFQPPQPLAIGLRPLEYTTRAVYYMTSSTPGGLSSTSPLRFRTLLSLDPLRRLASPPFSLVPPMFPPTLSYINVLV